MMGGWRPTVTAVTIWKAQSVADYCLVAVELSFGNSSGCRSGQVASQGACPRTGA
jgi:hypothetical protein